MIVVLWGSIINSKGSYWTDIINANSEEIILIARSDQADYIDNTVIKRFYELPIEMENNFKRDYDDENDAQYYWMTSVNNQYVGLFEKYIDHILKDFAISIVLSVQRMPKSMEVVCRKKGIPMGVIENAALNSNPPFNLEIGTLLFDKLELRKGKAECDTRFKEFDNDKDGIPFLSRKEIELLALGPLKKHIGLFHPKEKFEIGIALPDPDSCSMEYGDWSIEKILNYIRDEYKNIDYEKICIRMRPGTREITLPNYYYIDKSKSGYEFVQRCKKVYAISVGIPYLAVFAGKESYFVMDMNYEKDIKLTFSENKIEYANFVLFGFYTPWEKMFNEKYIKWRLSFPKQKDVYMDNITFFEEKYFGAKKILSKSSKMKKYRILVYKYIYEIKSKVRRKV